MNKLLIASSVALFTSCSAFAINKCTDAAGHITFTNGSCPQKHNWVNPPPALAAAPKIRQPSAEEVPDTVQREAPSGHEPADRVEQEAAEKLLAVLKATLEHPGSAQFRNVLIANEPYDSRKTETEYVICGEVNAKNGFGDYTGFEGFVVENNMDGKPTVYMQNNQVLGIIWHTRAKKVGCLKD